MFSGSSNKITREQNRNNKSIRTTDRKISRPHITPNAGRTSARFLRKKRDAPLSFIGKISKILFGTLDTEDAMYYNEQIDKAYNTTEHLAGLLVEQTHIVKSTLNSIQDNMKNITKALSKTRESLSELIQTTTRVMNHALINEINTQIITLLVEIDRHLNEFELDLANNVNAILFAKQGIVHPKILSPDQLIDSLLKIHILKSNVNMPIPLEIEYAEELIRVSELQVTFVENKLIYIYTDDTLTNIQYLLYVSFSTGTYHAKLNDRKTCTDFDKCSKLLGNYLCKRSQPLFHATTNRICEVSLFTNPQNTDLTLCDIRISSMTTPFWTQLKTPNTWIYSISNKEQIHISCPNEETTSITLTKTEILQISPTCRWNSATITLLTSRTYQSQTQKSYIPPINMSITDLHTSLKAINLSEIQLTSIKKDTHVNEIDLMENGNKLTDIINQAEKIKEIKRTKQKLDLLQTTTYSAGKTKKPKRSAKLQTSQVPAPAVVLYTATPITESVISDNESADEPNTIEIVDLGK
ncbi:hypothetical protein KPH14_012671 [Odynerus spinipes]|uniref:Envelope fusion protein n=1 Tax=Odynerus spinipes TaxID=1348599 RepID=A0AAD9R8I4_9HYME|nr:hypothetical protein KPH14_012671 [Odynerus spinipes]